MTSPHDECCLGVVLAAQEPDLAGSLLADLPGKQAGAVAAVERADPRPCLAEAGVVGGDRQVAADVEDVATADRVSGDHRDDRLRGATDLDLEIEDVEPPDALLGDVVVPDVAVVASDSLVAAGAEREVALAGQDNDADLVVVPREVEGLGQLEQGLRPERVADLRPVDRDLRDSVPRNLIADVGVVADRLPVCCLLDR